MKKYFYLNNISGLSKELSEEHYYKMLDSVSFQLVLERRNLKILLGGNQNEFVLFVRNFGLLRSSDYMSVKELLEKEKERVQK